mgnify:CR=1 FL=1
MFWMKRVQRELGMKISTEVANVKHVYEALKAGVDKGLPEVPGTHGTKAAEERLQLQNHY